jgi:hypothetical protein
MVAVVGTAISPAVRLTNALASVEHQSITIWLQIYTTNTIRERQFV